MNGKKLWVHFWTDRQKQSKRNNCNEGLKFLMSYDMTEPENVLKELQAGLIMTIDGKWGSGYVVIMPNIRREEELIRNRLATHPFEPSEWPIHEILGLPNRRYSIFIYNEHTCPQYASIAETDWRMEYSEGIPVYEKGFNVAYLNRTFPKLKRILISIYQGGTPQPTVLKPITTESKNNKNMKKNVQRINESQLRAIVAESVKKVLKESHSMEIEAALQDICRAASFIRNKTEYTQEEDYEPDYEIGYNDAAYLHNWASEIEEQAGEWLRN